MRAADRGTSSASPGREGTTCALPSAVIRKSASFGGVSTVFSRRAKYASAAGPVKRIVERSRIFASRQRGTLNRVGPAISVTGAATMRDAVICARVSVATVTRGVSTRTGRPTTDSREKRPERAHEHLARFLLVE